MLKVSTFSTTKTRIVLFLGSSTNWEVPSGVDYCTARICGGGGGGGGADSNSTAGANSTVSCGEGTFSGVGGDPVWIKYMGFRATCRSGRESSGESALFAAGRTDYSYAGRIPAAVNEFGIELIPGETVLVTVGAGGAQGQLNSATLPGSTATGGSGFVNIEYWI